MFLGKLTLENPFILAPMAGLTDSPFRRIMKRRKAAMVVSELISATGVHYTCQNTLKLFEFHKDEHPIGIQLFGSEREFLCKAAQHAEGLGADFVDLNLGCSVNKVTKRGGGAALATNVKKLFPILQSLVKTVRIPVSIKIRTGWDQNSRNAYEVIKAATDAGVSWIAIHGRTSEQGYSGLADWDFIASMKQKSTLPIIGNGDINTAQKALDFLHRYGVDAIMIGRASAHNPFIFEECDSLWRGQKYTRPTKAQYLSLIEEHRQYLEEFYPPRKALVLGRKFLATYATGLPDCRKFRDEAFHTEEPEILWRKGQEFFGNQVWENKENS